MLGVKKILSMSVLDMSVILVGNEMLGRRKKDSRESMKLLTGAELPHSKRLMLKSPIRTRRLFSLFTFCRNGIKKSSVKASVLMVGCL